MKRIVDIHRACGIDGDKGQVGQIKTRGIVQWRFFRGRIDQWLGKFIAPDWRQLRSGRAVLIFDPGCAGLAQAGQHFGRGLTVFDGVSQQCAVRQIPGADPVTRMGWDEQPSREARQIGHHEYRFAFLHNVTDKFVDTGL